MKQGAVLLTTLVVLAMAASAPAGVVTFTDTTPDHWPGYVDTIHPKNNTRDSVFTPDLKGGSLTLDAGRLTGIGIEYWSQRSNGGVLQTPGDVFISTAANNKFDYVLRSPWVGAGNQFGNVLADKLTWEVWKLDSAVDISNSASFETSDNAFVRNGKAHWSERGFNYRSGQPWALASGVAHEVVGSVAFSGFDNSTGSGTAIMSWTGLDIVVGDGVPQIGFTTNCGNDVILTPGGSPPDNNVVPEPAAAAIWLGLGALGLVLAHRRRKAR
jgi:MYXO-CTERM domain-containing protein